VLPRSLSRAVRSLTRAPGLVVAVGLTLALALGANAAVFAIVNAILLKPLPGVATADRLVNVHATAEDGTTYQGFSLPDYLDLRDRARSAVDLAAFDGRGLAFGEPGATELVGGQLVSGNYFSVLGTTPQLGRLLAEPDDRVEGEAPVAVISHSLWQRRFGGNPAAVGSNVRLNGYSFTIVGVAPEGFRGHFVGFPFDVWVPLAMARQAAPEQDPHARDSDWLELVARIQPGVGAPAAGAALAASAKTVVDEQGAAGRRFGVDVRPLTGVDDELRAPVLVFLGLLQLVAALVLVIAGVNVAGLLLARANTKRRDTAVRLALGAGTSRVIGQPLAEALLLSALGGAFGLLLALWTRDALLAFLPQFPIPLVFDLTFDGRVLAFTVLATTVLAGISSIAPALQATRLDVVAALKDSGAGALGPARLRRILAVGQVALSMLLLVAGSLFLRTLDRSRRLDPGFDPARVHLTRLDVSLLARNEAEGRSFYARLLERVAAAPGVASASLERRAPLGVGSLGTKVKLGRAGEPEDGYPVDVTSVSPGYFTTLRIPLLAGRDFGPTDDERGPRVAVVSDAFARRFWPAGEAVGQVVRQGENAVRIVGVARDTARRRLGEEPRPLLYTPLAQGYAPRQAVLVRAEGDPASVAFVVRDAVRTLEPDLPLLESMPLRDYMAMMLFPQRIAGVVTGAIGTLGLLLSMVGLSGVVALAVAARTREMGVRLALGACGADVMRLVLREGLGLALGGMALGLVAAAMLAPALGSLLVGVGPLDPVAFVAPSALLASCAFVASFLPARRAARLDPMASLRSE
jgi:putative ABC transport system permease protein